MDQVLGQQGLLWACPWGHHSCEPASGPDSPQCSLAPSSSVLVPLKPPGHTHHSQELLSQARLWLLLLLLLPPWTQVHPVPSVKVTHRSSFLDKRPKGNKNFPIRMGHRTSLHWNSWTGSGRPAVLISDPTSHRGIFCLHHQSFPYFQDIPEQCHPVIGPQCESLLFVF